MGLVIMTARSGCSEIAIEEATSKVSDKIERRSWYIPLSIIAPIAVWDLLFNQLLQVDSFIKLISLRSWVTNIAKSIEALCDLESRQLFSTTKGNSHTSMTFLLSMRRYLLPIICRSTVVNGRGRHLLVGFRFTLVTLAFFAVRHRSSIIVTAALSKR